MLVLITIFFFFLGECINFAFVIVHLSLIDLEN